MSQKTAIIIGAGPAGLTAAYELLQKTDIKPIVYEMTGDFGGISKTVNYKGNRIDIGGHRFFSKSRRIMQWWQSILPVQGTPSRDDLILGREIPLSPEPSAPDPEKTDKVLLTRKRVSRIYTFGRFFDYPLSVNIKTIVNLGLLRIFKIGGSYFLTRLFPPKCERTLEDFFIKRFGKELYLTFFKDYTEKVWGIGCNMIKSDWGAQRVKGLSLTKALLDAAKNLTKTEASSEKGETSLIRRFLYPKLGPGQMWEEVARIIRDKGGEIHTKHKITGINTRDMVIDCVTVQDETTGSTFSKKGDHVLSSMPVRDLIISMGENVPDKVKKIASGLLYRDFITVGLLVRELRMRNETAIKTIDNIIPDNWIYIQEKKVKLGRLQIFNNWSPYMVRDQKTMWLGLEYFCNEGDELWSKSDVEMLNLAIDELALIGFIRREDFLDGTVIRVPKAYPAYFGSYEKFDSIRNFTDKLENLYLIGRNGMHRYNNQDHSMLAAMIAVENIMNKRISKDNIWNVNTEQEYQES